MPANAITVFNNYIARSLVWWSLLKQSPYLQGCMICCIWNFTIIPILPTLNNSFFKRMIQPSLGTMSKGTQSDTPYFAEHLATLAYMPCIAVPLSIMLSAIGFIMSLIALIREGGMACVKDPLKLGKRALLLPRLVFSFMCLSTLKYINSAILLMPMVNILRVKFLRMAIDS